MKAPSTINKFLGRRAEVAAERMSLGDLTEAMNVRFDNTGGVARRHGSTLRHAGATHSAWGDGEVAFVVHNNTLCQVRPDLSLLPCVFGLAGEALHYQRVNGLLYWASPQRCGVIDPGTSRNRSWGLDVPELAHARAGAGALSAGRYQCSVTYVRQDGQESGASTALLLDLPDNAGVQVLVPASADPEVVSAALYLSTAGGTTLYRAAEFAPGAYASYSGNGRDLVMPLLTQFLSPPPPSAVSAFFAGRLWLGLDDAIFPSEPLSLELFNLMEYLPMTGRVTMLAPQADQSGMWVGTDSHLLYLTGNDPREMKVEVKLSEPVLPGTLVRVPGAKLGDGQFAGTDIALWAGPRGLYAGLPLPTGTVLSLTEARAPFALKGRGASYFDRDTNQVVMSAV